MADHFLLIDQCLLIPIKAVMTKSPNYNIGKEFPDYSAVSSPDLKIYLLDERIIVIVLDVSSS